MEREDLTVEYQRCRECRELRNVEELNLDVRTGEGICDSCVSVPKTFQISVESSRNWAL